jgi:hypothetical protein
MIDIGYIYAICDGATNQEVYVGQTVRNVDKRFRAHSYSINYSDTQLCRWWRQTKTAPYVKVIETVEVSLLSSREQYWIRFYGAKYGYMTNNNYNPFPSHFPSDLL